MKQWLLSGLTLLVMDFRAALPAMAEPKSVNLVCSGLHRGPTDDGPLTVNNLLVQVPLAPSSEAMVALFGYAFYVTRADESIIVLQSYWHGVPRYSANVNRVTGELMIVCGELRGTVNGTLLQCRVGRQLF